MRVALITLAFSLIVTGLAAQDPQGPSAPKRVVRCELEPEIPLTKDVFILLDVSGSMANEHADGRPLLAARRVMRSGSDQLNVAALAWSTNFCRWKTPDLPAADLVPGREREWAAFPSKTAEEGFTRWLGRTQTIQSTDPRMALAHALRERVKDLSVLFVTDGDFDPGCDVPSKINEGQDERERRGLGRAVFAVYAINASEDSLAELRKIAVAGKGGLWSEQRVLVGAHMK